MYNGTTALYLIKDGKTKYSIVIPTDATEVENNAAFELRSYLMKVTNVYLKIIQEKYATEPCIFIGHTDFARENKIFGNSEENWKVVVLGENLVLTGGTDRRHRGISYSVYHFLEDIVGIRWWNHAEEYVPQSKVIAINKEINLEGTPAFAVRKSISSWANVDFYSLAHAKINMVGAGDNVVDKGHSRSVRDTGGAYYPGPPSQAHTLGLYLPVEEYFHEHPDWWGWNEAEQRRENTRQHCLSSKDLQKAMEEKVLDNIQSELISAKNYGINPPAFFSITLSDDQKHCECPACVESVSKSGRSGHNIKFVNKIARAVAKKYPEVMLETLAYFDYIEPPLDDTILEPNVLLRLADIHTDTIHSINYPTNKRWLELVSKWSDICKKSNSPLLLWDYILNDCPLFPSAAMFQLPETYKTYYELGIKGSFVENELSSLYDFWACTQWMLCKYMEDPYLNFDNLLDDFLTKYYGEDAAKPIKKFLYLVHEESQNSNLKVKFFQNLSNWNFITPELVIEGLRLFDKAFEYAKGNPVYEQRLREAQASLYKCIAIQHNDLEKRVKQKGIMFELPTVKEAAEKVLFYLGEIREKYAFHIRDTSVHYDKFILKCIKYEEQIFNNLYENKESEPVDLPEFLNNVDVGNIYDIPAYTIQYPLTQSYISLHQDATSSFKKVLRFEAKALGLTDDVVDVKNWKLPVVLQRDESEDKKYFISVKDLSGGSYNWLHLNSIEGISKDNNSYLYVYVQEGLGFSLSSISRFFPIENCDVFISAKGIGSYFGEEEQENAILIDRFIIVRR